MARRVGTLQVLGMGILQALTPESLTEIFELGGLPHFHDPEHVGTQ